MIFCFLWGVMILNWKLFLENLIIMWFGVVVREIYLGICEGFSGDYENEWVCWKVRDLIFRIFILS